MSALLELRDLTVTYANGRVAADAVSFDVAAGETVALVGESGSGKSTVGLAVLGLLAPGARVESTSCVTFEGRDLLSLPRDAIRSLRGRRISMVFQEPLSALNPTMRALDQVAEVARVHGDARPDARRRASEMLARVGVFRGRAYPHELSGGQRQRVMIAMALLLRPALLIADEPTSALDVTVQAQILALLSELQRESGTAVLLITHDLGIVAETCARALVMRAGRVVESAPTRRLFEAPVDPYTAELIRAVPRLSVPA